MKPRVVVSACIGFEACRYDGEVIPNAFLGSLAPLAILTRVCPEVAIGLGTPRDPIRIEVEGKGERLVQPKTARDLTREMEAFAASWLHDLREVDGFVLKSRSPSCAVSDAKRHLVRGRRATRPGCGPGLFAEAVLASRPGVAVVDEGRLTNRRLRDHFLTRIFTTARLREARRHGMRGLVRFHAESELLFRAYNRKRMHAMDRVLANAQRKPVPEALRDYEAQLRLLLSRAPRTASHVKVAEHALGYVEKGLSAREKASFVRMLDGYREGRAPLSVVTSRLASWVARFDVDSLAGQTWFEPFPAVLVSG